MNRIALTLVVAGAVVASEASAQVMVGASTVPPGQRPPDGMCRVWIEGVAPGLQPRPTDCATARANAPLNSRIIYGGDGPFPGRAVGRFRDGDCEFERRSSNLGDLFFGLRTSQRDLDRDCRVSTSRSRDVGVWYPVGRDSNGNVIYERQVRLADGRVVAERARSRDGRSLARIGTRSDRRIDRDRDDDRRIRRDRDDDDDRRISKDERKRAKAVAKARRDREKQIRKAQQERAKQARKAQQERRKAQQERERAIERARRNAERDARRRGNGRGGNGRDG